MKPYEAQTFTKSGIKVNAVYVVKSGDTLSGIRKTVKRLGGNPADLEKMDPGMARGLAPGQFVYFKSDLPRAEELMQKVLNNHELERCPYQLVTLNKSDYKAKLDQHVGYPNAWIEVMALNRFQASDFATSPSMQVKVYHAKNSFSGLVSAKGQLKNNTLDQQLALVNETNPEKFIVIAERLPASEPHKEAGGGLVTVVFVILVVMLVIAYRGIKKNIALDSGD